MQKSIHPTWNHQATVTCACGNSFVTGSTKDQLTVDICSACHPFFTGEMRFVDRQGRVDKFRQRMELASQKQANQVSKRAKKASKFSNEPQEELKSYRQVLQEQRSSTDKPQSKSQAA